MVSQYVYRIASVAAMHLYGAILDIVCIVIGLLHGLYTSLYFQVSPHGYRKHASDWGWHVSRTNSEATNWHRSWKNSPSSIITICSKAEIKEALEKANEAKQTIKVFGALCSPNAMAFTDGIALDMSRYNRLISVDEKNRRVRVECGMSLKDLCEILEKCKNRPNGEIWSLPNLGSLLDQQIGGVLATGVHGTGVEFPCLAKSCVAFEIILPSGETKECSATSNSDLYWAGLCHLGALGVISEVTIQAEEGFKVRSFSTPRTFSAVMKSWKKDLSENDYYRIWLYPHTNQCVEWKANRVSVQAQSKSSAAEASEISSGISASPRFLWKLFRRPLSTLTGAIGSRFRDQGLKCLLEMNLALSLLWPYWNIIINKLWYWMVVYPSGKEEKVGLPSEVLTFDCLFRQDVLEYCIPLSSFEEAMMKISDLTELKIKKQQHKGVNFPIEVRFSKEDTDIFLSPATSFSDNRNANGGGRNGKLQGGVCWIGIIMYRPFGFTDLSLSSSNASQSDRTPKGKSAPLLSTSKGSLTTENSTATYQCPSAFTQDYFKVFTDMMEELGGRPHWAKISSSDANRQIRKYPQSKKWTQIAQQCDPHGVLVNEWLKAGVLSS